MYRDVAKFEIIGNVVSITARPSVTYVTVARNSLARDKANPDGPSKEVANYLDVRVFNDKDREYLSKHAKKGDLIRFEGNMQSANYEKDGEKRSQVELVSTGVAVLHKRAPREKGESTEDAQVPESGVMEHEGAYTEDTGAL